MDKKYVVNLQGKDYPTYQGVLDEAHNKGLVEIHTEMVQIPTEENGNVAIVKATAVFKEENYPKHFEAYGDASPKNVNSRIITALIRMAETRAKGRALRDGINVGQTMLEELPEEPKETPKPQDAKTESKEDYECPTCGAIAKKVSGVQKGKKFAGLKCTDNPDHKWNSTADGYKNAKPFDYKGHQVNQ